MARLGCLRRVKRKSHHCRRTPHVYAACRNRPGPVCAIHDNIAVGVGYLMAFPIDPAPFDTRLRVPHAMEHFAKCQPARKRLLKHIKLRRPRSPLPSVADKPGKVTHRALASALAPSFAELRRSHFDKTSAVAPHILFVRRMVDGNTFVVDEQPAAVPSAAVEPKVERLEIGDTRYGRPATVVVFTHANLPINLLASFCISDNLVASAELSFISIPRRREWVYFAQFRLNPFCDEPVYRTPSSVFRSEIDEVASVWRDVAPIRIETSIEPLAKLELIRLQVPFEDCRFARRPSTKDDRLVRLSRQYRVNPRRDFTLACLHF